ncbi:hypothetical protein AURDEDRAFT_116667 [Auricularia subglabra TFB-10046 SS5]|uniref:Protein kinase domain-containing protein n=1 Tax=Auricularia subglabra (strain TFB-10046 / SS5) TaxID=717982 RepID=J0D0N0_AURST|nr:hypothetical protein AURDEDRAFT_116667 [Auricularia subglabra TFB-10046 SS5]
MAPELMRDEPEQRGTQTDVFAFGMLIFEVYSGREPFDHLARRSAAVQLAMGRRPARTEISHGDFTLAMWHLVTACWAQDPSERPNMARVAAQLA